MFFHLTNSDLKQVVEIKPLDVIEYDIVNGKHCLAAGNPLKDIMYYSFKNAEDVHNTIRKIKEQLKKEIIEV